MTGLTVLNGHMYHNNTLMKSCDQKSGLLDFLTFLENLHHPILVAHNCANFDAKVLMNALKVCDMLVHFKAVCIGFADTLSMFKKVLPKQDCYKQQFLVETLLKMTYPAHNAVEDCESLIYYIIYY